MKYCKSPLCSLKSEVYFGVLFVGVQSSSFLPIDLKNKWCNQPMTARRARILPVIFTTLFVLATRCEAAGGYGHGAHPCQGDWMTYLVTKWADSPVGSSAFGFTVVLHLRLLGSSFAASCGESRLFSILGSSILDIVCGTHVSRLRNLHSSPLAVISVLSGMKNGPRSILRSARVSSHQC